MPAECLDLTLNRQISQIPGVLGQESTFRRCRSMVLPSGWSNKDVSNGFEAFFYPESPVRIGEDPKFDQGDPKNCTNGKIKAAFPLKKSGRRRTTRANVPWKRAHCESSVLQNGTHCKRRRSAEGGALRERACGESKRTAEGGVPREQTHCESSVLRKQGIVPASNARECRSLKQLTQSGFVIEQDL